MRARVPGGRLRVTRLVFDEKQRPQPRTDQEQVLSDHDVQYLLRFLAQSRNESYELVGRPDERERQRPAPDYLFREKGSGRLIAIERTQLLREDLQAAKARHIKMGAGAVVIGPVEIDPGEVATFLVQAIARKIERGQLREAEANERILLIRNRILATAYTFLRYPIRFVDADECGVDHTYLIASSQLLQLW
jgi:hypothetical protein